MSTAQDPPPDPYGHIVYRAQTSPEQQKDPKLWEAVKEHPKIGDLVTAHVALKEKLGRAVIIPNAEKPDPEELKTFRQQMGLPEKAEDYKFDTATYQEIEGVKEVVELARADSAGMGLTQAQAQKHFDSIMRLSKAGRDAVMKARKEAVDNYEPRLLELVGKDQEKATAAKNQFTAELIILGKMADRIKPGEGTALVKRLSAAGFLHDPVFTLIAAELQGLMGEEPFSQGGPAPREKADKGKQSVSKEFESHYGTRAKPRRRG